MSTSAAAGPPRGREAVKRALLDAAAELFAAHGWESVSVRDIAKAADVNHGLVHRHFGSKDALLRAVMENLSARIAELGSVDAGSLTTPEMNNYWRLLARGILDGLPIGELQGSFPVVNRFRRQVENGQKEGVVRCDVDATSLAALGVAAGLGWLLFEPFVVAALGLERSDSDDRPAVEGSQRKSARARVLSAWLSVMKPPRH